MNVETKLQQIEDAMANGNLDYQGAYQELGDFSYALEEKNKGLQKRVDMALATRLEIENGFRRLREVELEIIEKLKAQNQKMREALEFVKIGLEEYDWSCRTCGDWYPMTLTDLYSHIEEALKDGGNSNGMED